MLCGSPHLCQEVVSVLPRSLEELFNSFRQILVAVIDESSLQILLVVIARAPASVLHGSIRGLPLVPATLQTIALGVRSCILEFFPMLERALLAT